MVFDPYGFERDEIEALVSAGHTHQCASGQVWRDRGCMCGLVANESLAQNTAPQAELF